MISAMKNNEAGKEDWEYWTKMKSLILFLFFLNFILFLNFT